MKKREILGAVLAFIAIIMLMTYSWDEKSLRKVVYDCGVSEISPDYPIEVKEACRRIQAERNNR